MIENISAHFPQQGILGLEMGIEGASPDIRLIKYLLDSDIVKMFLFQQLTKCLKDCTPCFQLSSVHNPICASEQIAGIVQYRTSLYFWLL